MCVNVHTLWANCGEWDEVEQVAEAGGRCTEESRPELHSSVAVFSN